MMKYILLIALIAMTACTNAQVGKLNAPPPQKELVADETWIVASGKSSFRVICSNDSISHWIRRKFENNGITKFTYVLKKDRKGQYWERSFYFKNEEWNMVVLFINNRFK
jgi:hypothetical protein